MINIIVIFLKSPLIFYREQKFRDDVYRCHYTLSGLHLNAKSYQKALQCAKLAVMTAKNIRNKQQELDAQLQLGIVSFVFYKAF